MQNIILGIVVLLVLAGCSQQIITKYQCQNGEVVDSIDLCQQRTCRECPECEVCPECPTVTCSSIEVPYLENESYQYFFQYGIVEDSTIELLLDTDPLNWGVLQSTKVKNFEEKLGKFTVKHLYRTLKKSGTKEVSAFLNGGETYNFNSTFDIAFGEDVEVTTKVAPHSETRYREVVNYRTIEVCNCS